MRRYLWLVVGLALVVAGVVMVLNAPTGPMDAGWFAYTPLSDDPDWFMEWEDGDGSANAAVILTRQHVAAFGVIALGLLVLVAGAAYWLGRRQRRMP